MNKDQALAALDRLDRLIGNFGGPYEEEHREFKSIIYSLRAGPLQTPYFREKLSDLESQANDGFSVRRFANRPGGLQQVRVWALGSLSTARSLVEEYWPVK